MRTLAFGSALLSLVSLLTGCIGGPNGDLIGVEGREPWIQDNPYGMNYIHYGSFVMGPSDQDAPFAVMSKSRTITLPAFYMDVHEITNNEYRQFVNYVQDSIYREVLASNDLAEFQLVDQQIGEMPESMLEYQKDFYSTRYGRDYLLNWEEPIDWVNNEQVEALIGGELFRSTNQRMSAELELNPDKLVYRYWWMDLDRAAQTGYDNELSEKSASLGDGSVDAMLPSVKRHSDRSQFIFEENIAIYPDTNVWMTDHVYADRKPQTKMYFWHPAYDDYPVVGVTWSQARAFNAWRTQLMSNYRLANGESIVQEFRLPTEAEWEYAARGGYEQSPYPWGGPYTRNRYGCELANFKPMRGDYAVDGGVYTMPVESYTPNEYGLYQMAGNVAEWTSTSYHESLDALSHDLSPEYQYLAYEGEPGEEIRSRMVVRGGSWKDIGYLTQNGTRTFEYRDVPRSYIGFRSVMSYLGRGKSVRDMDSWNEY